MVSSQTCEHFSLSFQDIKAMPEKFGGISVILSEDLLQLPPVQQQENRRKGAYRVFQDSLWEDIFYFSN